MRSRAILWRPTQREVGLAFFSEAGDFFQLRYLEGGPEGQRYDAQAQAGTQIFTPAVPPAYRQHISQVWDIGVPLEGSFWDWVKAAPECPVFICEGPAKALALIGGGHPAVAGYGAFGGVQRHEYKEFKRPIGQRKSGKSGGFATEKLPLDKPRLAPGIAELAAGNRLFLLVPDQDANPTTRRSVANAYLQQARLLKQRGCRVRILWWDGALGKGIDDVITAQGWDVFDTILEAALTPDEYRLKIELSFELAPPSAIVQTRNLQDDAPELPKQGIVYSDAAVGTGKTKLAARETAGRTLLAPYPLRSLAKAAAVGLDANYRNEGQLNRNLGAYFDGEQLSDRLTICYDSLPRLDLTNQFGGELEDLLLDEVTHGLRHALTGATCRAERLAIVEQLVRAVQTSKRVLMLDADLTRIELDLIRTLRPNDVEFYLQNRQKPTPWDVHWLTLASAQPKVEHAIVAVYSVIQDRFPRGLIHWACDSRKTTERVAQYLGDRGEHCAVINAVTVHDQDPRALLALAGEFDALEAQGVRFIITSPSVVQGLSWEETGRFVAVAGTFTGCSITPRQMRQGLSRVREAVPRILWASPHRRQPGYWGQETNPQTIRRRILDLSGFSRHLLHEPLEMTPTRETALDFAAQLLAEDNKWRATPAASLKVLLEHDGHRLRPFAADVDAEAVDLFAASAANWAEKRRQSLLQARILTPDEAQTLRQQPAAQALSQEDRLALERDAICQFYAIAPEALTLEWLRLDEDGSLRSQIRAFEQLLSPDGQQLAEAITRQSLPGADVDVRRALAARTARTALGLPELIETLTQQELDKDSPELQALAAQCQHYKGAIKTALNYTVKAEVEPIQLLSDLLLQLGIKLDRSRRRVDGERRRYCRINLERFGFLQEVAQRRYQQRVEVDLGPVPPPSGSIRGGVGQQAESLYPPDSKAYSGVEVAPPQADQTPPPVLVDQRALRGQAKSPETAWGSDFQDRAQVIDLLARLQLHLLADIYDRGEWIHKEHWAVKAIFGAAIEFQQEVKEVFNLTVSAEGDPMAFVSDLLKRRLGLGFERSRKSVEKFGDPFVEEKLQPPKKDHENNRQGKFGDPFLGENPRAQKRDHETPLHGSIGKFGDPFVEEKARAQKVKVWAYRIQDGPHRAEMMAAIATAHAQSEKAEADTLLIIEDESGEILCFYKADEDETAPARVG